MAPSEPWREWTKLHCSLFTGERATSSKQRNSDTIIVAVDGERISCADYVLLHVLA